MKNSYILITYVNYLSSQKGIELGQKIEIIYKNVLSKYGQIGVYRLIVKSRISEEEALRIEDTDVNIAMVKGFAEELGLTVTTEVVKKRRGILGRLLRRK